MSGHNLKSLSKGPLNFSEIVSCIKSLGSTEINLEANQKGLDALSPANRLYKFQFQIWGSAGFVQL